MLPLHSHPIFLRSWSRAIQSVVMLADFLTSSWILNATSNKTEAIFLVATISLQWTPELYKVKAIQVEAFIILWTCRYLRLITNSLIHYVPCGKKLGLWKLPLLKLFCLCSVLISLTVFFAHRLYHWWTVKWPWVLLNMYCSWQNGTRSSRHRSPCQEWFRFIFKFLTIDQDGYSSLASEIIFS